MDGLETAKPTALSALTYPELAKQHVIVSLQGDVSSYIPEVPFHTSALEWDVGPVLDSSNIQDMEALYRNLALQIKDLVDLVCGEEV